MSYPELSVGMTTEGIDVRSVGNSMTLHETALVEAFNLKAAMEYQLKNCEYGFVPLSFCVEDVLIWVAYVGFPIPVAFLFEFILKAHFVIFNACSSQYYY